MAAPAHTLIPPTSTSVLATSTSPLCRKSTRPCCQRFHAWLPSVSSGVIAPGCENNGGNLSVRDDRCGFLAAQIGFPSIGFVVHVAAAEEGNPVEHAFLKGFQGEVDNRRDVEGNQLGNNKTADYDQTQWPA